MILNRESTVNDIKKIIERYTNVSDNEKLLEMSENTLESAIHFVKFLSQNNSANDLEKLINNAANNSDTFVRKVLAGTSLAFAFGTLNLPPDVVGGLTGAYISKVYGNFNSDEKTSVTNIMRDTYVFSRKNTPL